MDPGIVCFQHCGQKIFCLELPEVCPACGDDLDGFRCGLLPFRVPYPFVRASQHPCSVVIKPTEGDFLNDYRNSKDLHIGVTSSEGEVVEFDRSGVRAHLAPSWTQCLLLDSAPAAWADLWDETLDRVCASDEWTPITYHDSDRNCYSFVLAFLRELSCGALSEAAANRTTFCEKYIVPKTTAAGKYISLYRKLKQNGYYIHSKSKDVKKETT